MNIFLLQKTKKLLLKKFNSLPQIAIITGSGIKLFKNTKPFFSIKYNDLPIWSNKKRKREVKGHEKALNLYKLKNKSILVFSGRRHLYEGLSINEVVENVRLAYELGVQKIIITNASGGINNKLKIGDLVLITGFINLMQPTERGILDSITQKPKRVKTNLTSYIQNKFKKYIKTGTYAGLLGPSYETYSEIKLLKILGADTVGMSTIPEMICANSLLLDYAGISVVSNIWDQNHIPSHKEVLKHVNKANKKLDNLITKLVK